MLAAELDYLLDITNSGQVKKAKAERKALSHYSKSPGHWKTGYGKRLETTEIAEQRIQEILEGQNPPLGNNW